MTIKQITAISEAVPALTERQRARLLASAALTAEDCARHPRTIKGYNELRAVSTLQSYQGMALRRDWHIIFCIKQGRIDSTEVHEVLRVFHEQSGRRHFFALPLRPMSPYWDGYDYDKPLRRHPEPKPYSSRDSQICASYSHQIIFSQPDWLLRQGYARILPTSYISKLATREGEILAKWGYYDFLDWRNFASVQRDEYILPALRVAHRHGYQIDDASLYLDYLRDLHALGLDLHSPHYLCPDDLRAAHAATTARCLRIAAAQRVEAQRKRDADSEKSYAKRLGRYLGIALAGDGFTLRPLQSVAEFYEEGQAMHHCVYSCDYYSRKDTLILTARDNAGNRLATIELNLRTLQVVQCRGLCNRVPERYDDIISLINSNRQMFNLKKAAA